MQQLSLIDYINRIDKVFCIQDSEEVCGHHECCIAQHCNCCMGCEYKLCLSRCYRSIEYSYMGTKHIEELKQHYKTMPHNMGAYFYDLGECTWYETPKQYANPHLIIDADKWNKDRLKAGRLELQGIDYKPIYERSTNGKIRNSKI